METEGWEPYSLVFITEDQSKLRADHGGNEMVYTGMQFQEPLKARGQETSAKKFLKRLGSKDLLEMSPTTESGVDCITPPPYACRPM